VTIVKHSDGVSFSARHLFDFHLFESNDQFGFGLVWAAIFVFGHRGRVRVTELTAATSTPGVKSPAICQSDGVSITACYLHDFYRGEKVNKARRGLVRITLDIGRQILHRRQAELATSTCPPGVDIAANVDSNSVAVSSRYLINPFVSELIDLEWKWLQT